jgi:chemotaxis protein MotD
MRSIEDALPAARPVRNDVGAIKAKQGDEDGGRGFSKAFAAFDAPKDALKANGQRHVHGDKKDDAAVTAAADDMLPAGSLEPREGKDDRIPSRETLPANARSAAKAETGAAVWMRNPEALAFMSLPVPPAKADEAIPAEPEQAPDGKSAPLKTPTSTIIAKAADGRWEKPDQPAAVGSGKAKVDPPLGATDTAKPLASTDQTLPGILTTEPDAVLPAQARKGPLASLRPDVDQDARVATERADKDGAPLNAPAPNPSEQTDIRSLMALLGPSAAMAVTGQAEFGQDGAATSASSIKTETDGALTGMAPPKTSEKTLAAEAERPASTDQPDRIFRLARPEARTSALSMRGGGDGGKAAGGTETASARMDTVTVLDARRYLGIAPTPVGTVSMSANAQSVASAIAGSGNPAQSLDANSSLSMAAGGATGKVVNTLKIQMHPIDLGLVTATLRLRGEELQIDLRVRTGEAYRQLSDDQDAMVKALQAQGFQVDQVNVIYAPSDGGAGSETPAQQQGNQQPTNTGRDGQNGLASGGESRNGSSGQRNEDDRRAGSENLREAAATAQSGLSDDLYL